MKRRRFTREFKLEALRKVGGERSVGAVAREIGVTPHRLHAWKRSFAASVGDGRSAPKAIAFPVVPASLQNTVGTNEAVHILLEVHDSETGHVDAVAFARALNMPLATLADILICDTASLCDGDTRDDVRERLNEMYRLIAQLRNKLGSLSQVRVWLHAPHPELQKGTPIQYLRRQRIRPLAAVINAMQQF